MMWTREPAGTAVPTPSPRVASSPLTKTLTCRRISTPLVAHLGVEHPVLGEGSVEELGHGLRVRRGLDLELRDTAHEVAQHAGQDHADGGGRHTESFSAQAIRAARTTSTSGSWVAMRWNDSPSSADAKTSPLRVPR